MSDIDQFASLLADAWNTSPERMSGDVDDYRSLLKAIDAKVQRLGRTVARNRFNTLADSNDITLVTSHDNAENGVVIMRGSVLAELIQGAVETAVKKASRRRPLTARLEGLKPLPGGDDNVRISYRTGQVHHRLHLADELPVAEAVLAETVPEEAVPEEAVPEEAVAPAVRAEMRTFSR